MNQAVFTEKEIKQVFDALLQERKRVEELIAENSALCTQGQQLIKMLKIEKEQAKKAAEEIGACLAKTQAEKSALEEQLATLCMQWDLSLHAKEKEQLLLQEKDASILHLKQQLSALTAENAHLQRGDEEFKNKLGLIEQELAAIRATMHQAVKQSKEIELRFAKAVEEKIAALTLVQQLNGEMDKIKRERAESKKRFELQLEEVKLKQQHTDAELQKQKDLFQERGFASQNAIEALAKERQAWELEKSELRAKIDRQENEAHVLNTDKQARELQCDRLHAQMKESQAAAEYATQHVARKIREAAELQLLVEELHAEIARYRAETEENKEQRRQAELQIEQQSQAEAEWQQLAEQKGHELAYLQEKLRQSELEKEKLELQLLTFKELENKHVQLEQLFNGFGSILKTSVDIRNTPEQPELQTSSLGQNLFDLPAVKARTKAHLFE